VLCGEILLENGIGFHEVSYKRLLLMVIAFSIDQDPDNPGSDGTL
jgi:hypothetical protein